MKKHIFGGMWTQKKLAILRSYLEFYVNALKDQRFKLIYIDAFAGTGRCTIKIRGNEQTIPGSASIALDIAPPFEELIFIEKKARHVHQLQELLRGHPIGKRATIFRGTAEQNLENILAGQNWRNTRGVLFLDPYGLQCDWETVKRIAATKALDVFFLVSLSGMYRQATNNLRDVDDDKRQSLTRFLGTADWEKDLYSIQTDLFGDKESLRHANPEALAEYMQARLQQVFAKVTKPIILYHEDAQGRRGAPLYALFFAVSNPSRKAVELASRVSKEIMSKLQ